MIISHKKKFIFIKTRKTAGTSIELALSKFCGEDDIITPVKTIQNTRSNLGYDEPRNYDFFRGHATALEIRKLIGKDIWNDYYKFCFERNPYDKAVSLFYFHQRKRKFEHISKMLNKLKYQEQLRNFYQYTDKDNNIIVDKVYFYEDLDQSLKELKTILKLEEDIILPNIHSNLRQVKGYKHLSETDILKISQICKFEIDTFGYEF